MNFIRHPVFRLLDDIYFKKKFKKNLWHSNKIFFFFFFFISQDTVVGLYALSKLGERLRTNEYDVTVTFTTDAGEQKDIHINSRNFMIVQKHLVSIVATESIVCVCVCENLKLYQIN